MLIVASRGGPKAVSDVLRSFPRDFKAAVVLVLHRAELPGGAWTDIVRRASPMQVEDVRRGERLRPGTVYLAPATQHARVTADGAFAISDGTRIRGVLSSANPLFESAGVTLGPRAIAVVLTGYGRDATDGVQAIRAGGGVVIAQDESTSRDFGMPSSAIGTGVVDLVLPIDQIGPRVVQLVEQRSVPTTPGS